MKGYEEMTLKECLENIGAIKFLIILKEDLLQTYTQKGKNKQAQSTKDIIERLNKELKKLEDNLEVIQSKEINNTEV